MPDLDHWPVPPIWPEDVDDVRELLTLEEWRELLRRHLVSVADRTKPPGAGPGGTNH